jgi:hypothetical protein
MLGNIRRTIKRVDRRSVIAISAALCVTASAFAAKDVAQATDTSADRRPVGSFASLDGTRSHWISANAPAHEAEETLGEYPELVFEGNWQVEWRDHSMLSSAQLWLVKGLMLGTQCTNRSHYATCRDPLAPWQSNGSRPGGEGDGAVVDHQFYVLGSTGDMIEVEHWSGTKTSLRRQPGSTDELVGTWTDRDGNEGAEIWRRVPPPKITRVACGFDATETTVAAGEPCKVAVPAAAGPNAMRGNLPTVRLEIFGTNLYGAGPLPVHLNWDRTKIEIQGYCYLYEGSFGDGPHGCASWGNPTAIHGEIIGVRVELNVTYGARSGIKRLWLAGQAVAFDLTVPEDETAEEAELVRIETVSPLAPHEPLSEVGFGGQYRIQLIYDTPPDADTASVTVQDGLSGHEFAVTAYPSGHPLIFRTDVIDVGALDAEGVPQ